MTLRIQCPACQRQFKVSDELQGRTVECGACEKQFTVDAQAIVQERERYFPGDIKKKGLDHYGRAPERTQQASVGFATASYNEGASAADVAPPSPQRMIACALGILLLIFFAILLLFGSQVDGLLKDVQLEKRIVLGAFIAFVGAALILYGGFRRKVETVLLAVGLGGVVVGLAIFLPVPDTVEDSSLKDRPSGIEFEAPGPVAPRPLTEAEAMEEMGYKPVQDAFKSFGDDAVIALWAPSMKERFKYQILRYLHRKTGTSARPSFYNRRDGALIVIEGTQLDMTEVEALVQRFARVEDVYPNLKVLKISIEGERLLEPSLEDIKKLNDKSHPSFYVHNKAELDHIIIDRVKDAAQRLASVEPKRFRTEIAQRLVELLAEDDDPEFQETICSAITVWSIEGDGAEAAVARSAQRLVVDKKEVSRNMIEFPLARKSPEVIPLLEILWKEDPNSWQSLVIEAGRDAEEFVAANLMSDDRGLQRSAGTILRKIGTRQSLPALRKAMEKAGGDEDTKLALKAAIEAIERR